MSLVGGGITAKILAKRTKTGARVRRRRGVMFPRLLSVRPSRVRRPSVRPSLPRLALCRVGRSIGSTTRRRRGLLDLALDSRRTKKPIHHFPRQG